ncbi:MAG: exodeoxyribonuclease VII small subunit [Spirochaetia bacterium]|jgi:exodeoxyribonuclease VII small subunit|nr:exodeoxyribonuclease VII small subunit [Spirochaetales bacterium]
MKSFEDRFNRLENLSEKLREGKIPLEEAVSIFEEGMKLAKELEKELAKIERKVEILVNEPEKKGEAAQEPALELFPELEEGGED